MDITAIAAESTNSAASMSAIILADFFISIRASEKSLPGERAQQLRKEIAGAVHPEPYENGVHHDRKQHNGKQHKRYAPPPDLPVLHPAKGLGMVGIVYAIVTSFHIIYYIIKARALKR